jgi:hypothetical protein
MTAEPFDADAYWLGRERDDEWWRWDCAECGATRVGDPLEHDCEVTP